MPTKNFLCPHSAHLFFILWLRPSVWLLNIFFNCDFLPNGLTLKAHNSRLVGCKINLFVRCCKEFKTKLRLMSKISKAWCKRKTCAKLPFKNLKKLPRRDIFMLVLTIQFSTKDLHLTLMIEQKPATTWPFSWEIFSSSIFFMTRFCKQAIQIEIFTNEIFLSCVSKRVSASFAFLIPIQYLPITLT